MPKLKQEWSYAETLKDCLYGQYVHQASWQSLLWSDKIRYVGAHEARISTRGYIYDAET